MKSRIFTRLCKALVFPVGLTRLMGSITSVATHAPAMALTFDDGPDPASTPILLDLLKAHGAKATFFVVGEQVQKHPSIVERAFREGHAICNHGWSHRSLPTLAPSEQDREIRRCAEIIARWETPYFRPPYGHQSIRSRRVAAATGQRVVIWSAAVADWRTQSRPDLARRIREAMVPGAILLLHDSIRLSPEVVPSPDLQCDRTPLFETLDVELGALSKRFQFVTLPQLFEIGRPRFRNWFWFDSSVA